MNIDRLNASELRLLIEVAVVVLAEELGEDERDRLVDLPTRRAESELTALLSEAGAADASALAEALGHTDSGETTARRLLSEVLSSEREVAEPISAAYEKRKSMMALDASLITGPVLLAIVLLRIKRLKISKAGVDIQFADSKGLAWLFDLLRGGGGAK